MADLSTKYMGLELRSPLVVASCTLTADPDKAAALEAAGAGALVMKSIFEEQVRADVADMYEDLDSLMHPEAFEYLSADLPMQLGPEKYLQRIAEVKAAVGVPLIASVNCSIRTQWISFAERIQGAGADAIELNIYDIPDDPDQPGAEVERKHLDLVTAIKKAVSVPVAVKIGPYYSSLLEFARRLAGVEVDAIVLFNRFFQPDIDVDTLKLKTGINFSRPEDIRVPLRWIAMLRDPVVGRDLAGCPRRRQHRAGVLGALSERR